MKILIIRTFPDILKLDSYNVQEVGLAKALNAKGHTCDIVLYHGKQPSKVQQYSFEKDGKEYSFRIFWLKGFGILKNGFMPEVKKLLPEYEVIQVHEYDQLSSWFQYTGQKQPTIVYHGPYYDAFAKGYHLKCRVFDRMFLPWRRVDRVVAVAKSSLAAEFLKEKGFRRIITAGVGINTDNFQDSEAKSVSREPNMLLYIGKLEPRRNPYFLIEVFRTLQKCNPKLRLVFVGDGEADYREGFLKHIAREVEEGSIQYIPSASQRELAEYYKRAALFVFPTFYGIFGMVLLEAMYFEVPVISSRNGGSATLIQNGRNGFLIEEFEVSLWADSIQKALQDREGMLEIGRQAHKTIVEEYTWDALADRFLTAYQEAVNSFHGK